ncbi:MAG TPA: type II toxin-antitoxin system VapC family toxin [Candidatus Binatia bacterium]|nr:type II toxin-antitoxin system VapC family toxin [Candidatus Binatia bacterium]
MIVVDTNLIAYLYLQGEHTAQAEKVLQKDSEWMAPSLWRSEFRSVLAFYLRQKDLSLDDAQAIMWEAELLLQGREYSVASARVLDIAAASRCSAYDCEFVVLAQDLDVPLVTADKKVLAAFPETAVSMVAFISATGEPA